MKRSKVLSVLNWCLLPLVVMMLASCSSSLPKGEATTKSPWETFEQAKASYDSIVPFETVTSDLEELGFDPYSTPNVRILSYLDIIKKFNPSNSVRKSVV